ncbi:temptin-like [Liolophura sinensis]|uniref:temptin-like n=1 Tax=Liolophura sinensis TaxID=3198878 RepID=UPI0031585158
MSSFRHIVGLPVLVAVASVAIYGHRNYMDRIPNGYTVPNPCVPGQAWQASGHYDYLTESGPVNIFGDDFGGAGHRWTTELCRMDSDGDGRTNGQELGDPQCVWTPGATPQMNATGHPGVCEPMNSTRCPYDDSICL